MTCTDWLLLVAVIGSLPVLYTQFWARDEVTRYLQVQQGNQPANIIALTRDQALELDGPLGTSHVEIHEGQARFTHSPCPGKNCIQAGWLPNRISIQLLGMHPRFDTINF